MKTHKTDESVKAGLQLEANTNPDKKAAAKSSGYIDEENEKDGDELAHELPDEPTMMNEEEHDMDELVHKMPPTKTIRDNDEEDPDDLVHQK